jgi:hypothetical protein
MWTVWWGHNRRTIEDLDSFASFEFFASSLFAVAAPENFFRVFNTKLEYNITKK